MKRAKPKPRAKAPSGVAKLKGWIDAAQGRVQCDLLIRDVRFLDVFSCEFRKGDVAVHDGRIVGIEPGLKARRVIEGRGATLVPGFIDAHVHVESSMMLPLNFEGAVLPRGTTTAICDPHEIANVVGTRGIRWFLDASARLSMDLRVMLSSCVPSTHSRLETNGAGTIEAKDLLPLARHPKALGLAEMMNMPGVLHADPGVLRKLEAFGDRVLDGHCPRLRGRDLSTYAAAGISSCHESTELEEAREKLTKGIACWIREGSVAKDLDALAPLLTLATSTSMGFCTDDRNPYDIAEEGHVDHLIRGAIAKGVPAAVAYRAASWSVARHYGLATGRAKVGAVAPGYRADLVLLDDEKTCAVRAVFKDGVPADEVKSRKLDPSHVKHTVKCKAPEERRLEGPGGRVHVITVEEGKILTGREVAGHADEGVARLSVIERYGHGRAPANGYVRGFGRLRGAIASSVGHDSHNLIVVGSDPRDMRVAVASLIESGGGFAVAEGGRVTERLELPYGGLMSERGPAELRGAIGRLKEASRAAGCGLREPFLQLAFLSLPVIPSLKLTDRGLVDVDKFAIIDVRA